jgi:multiple sugar transport system permease protein
MKRWFQSKSINTPSPVGALLSYLVLGFWGFIILFPLYWLVVTSFKISSQVAEGPFYIPFVDFIPSLDAWKYILVGDLSQDTIRNFSNTLIVAPTSALIALVLGATAAYALVRFEYRPRVGVIWTFIGCVVLSIVTISLGVPWQVSLAVSAAVFFILLQTIGRRFKRALGNNDIAFWIDFPAHAPSGSSCYPNLYLISAPASIGYARCIDHYLCDQQSADCDLVDARLYKHNSN